MSKDTIAGIVAVTGIVLAIGVLLLGDRSNEVASLEETEVADVIETPEVVYKTIERTVIVEKEVVASPPQSAPYAVRRAAAEMRAQQAREISDLEPTDEDAMREALKAEAASYRRGI